MADEEDKPKAEEGVKTPEEGEPVDLKSDPPKDASSDIDNTDESSQKDAYSDIDNTDESSQKDDLLNVDKLTSYSENIRQEFKEKYKEVTKNSYKKHYQNATHNIPVVLKAVIGESNVKISNLLKIGRGAVIELDQNTNQNIEIHVEGVLIANAEVVFKKDKLAVCITRILKRTHNKL